MQILSYKQDAKEYWNFKTKNKNSLGNFEIKFIVREIQMCFCESLYLSVEEFNSILTVYLTRTSFKQLFHTYKIIRPVRSKN